MRRELTLIMLAYKRRSAALELITQQDIVHMFTERGMVTQQHRQALREAQKKFDKASDAFDDHIEKYW